jgi:hypothetical protein
MTHARIHLLASRLKPQRHPAKRPEIHFMDVEWGKKNFPGVENDVGTNWRYLLHLQDDGTWSGQKWAHRSWIDRKDGGPHENWTWVDMHPAFTNLLLALTLGA